MALGPLESHSAGVTRSSSLVENNKLFSGENAQRETSGGGVDVTALSSLPAQSKDQPGVQDRRSQAN